MTGVKRRLTILAGVTCVLVVLFVAWLASGSSYPRRLIGQAWILMKQVPVTVEIDGHRLEEILCFAEPRSSQHPPERLILGVETAQGVYRYGFLILDLDHQCVLLPNPGDRYNKVLHNGWLLQSDAGATGVDLADPIKGGELPPDFRRSGNIVSFTLTPTLDLPGGRWTIDIGGDGHI